jgi:hypothetical protein
MKEPYGEGLASHTDPESWWCGREAALQALTGARAGRLLSREETSSGCRRRDKGRKATLLLPQDARQYEGPARSKNPSTLGTSLRENRESPRSPIENGAMGRAGKSEDGIRR